MHPVELARWQWSDYADVHSTRRNLAIHIVAVPVFCIGNALALFGLVAGGALWPDLGFLLGLWLLVPLGVLLSLAGIAAQGKGHAGEPQPPKPFTSAGNAVGRILTEQWITFPRFVVTGGWARAWRAARAPAEA